MRFGIWFCLQEGFWIKSAVPVFDLEINSLLREKLYNYDNDIFSRKPKQEVEKIAVYDLGSATNAKKP